MNLLITDLKNFEKIRDYAKEENVDFVLVGDLFDHKLRRLSRI